MAKTPWTERLEVWLDALARRLSARGIPAQLAYDDAHGGQELVCAMTPAEGFCELQVRRRDRAAEIVLLCESQAAAAALAGALAGAHREVGRLHNVRRRFYHRLERLARHLSLSFAARSSTFPRAQLALLQSRLPDAAPLSGARAAFRERGEKERSRAILDALTGREARRARRYPTCHGVKLCQAEDGSCRAVLFDASQGRFRLGVPLAAALTLAGVGLTAEALAPLGLAPADEGQLARRLEWAGEALDLGLDLPDALSTASGCADVGGCDLPDCDACDLPDLGGCACDLPLPDCAL